MTPLVLPTDAEVRQPPFAWRRWTAILVGAAVGWGLTLADDGSRVVPWVLTGVVLLLALGEVVVRLLFVRAERSRRAVAPPWSMALDGHGVSVSHDVDGLGADTWRVGWEDVTGFATFERVFGPPLDQVFTGIRVLTSDDARVAGPDDLGELVPDLAASCGLTPLEARLAYLATPREAPDSLAALLAWLQAHRPGLAVTPVERGGS